MSPGPGSYSVNQNVKGKVSFNYGIASNFGSSNRTLVTNGSMHSLGPGEYDIHLNSISSYPKSNKCNKIIKDIRQQLFGKKNKVHDEKRNGNNPENGIYQIIKCEPNFSHGVEKNIDRKENRFTKFYSL
jgi:hypothetical protein